jgi:hypothetical protein
MDLPAAYWEFANRTAAYLRNRGVVKNMTKSPWELWRNEKPKARHLRVFGCPAWVLIPKEKRTKLAKRAWQGVFVGYKEETDKIYLVWNPADKKVHEARFVEFDESKYMDNEISQESQSEYDDEKDGLGEQGELTDDESDAGDSAQDRATDQEAVESEEDTGEKVDGNPTDQDTADSAEELQGDTIIVDIGEADNSSTEAERPTSGGNANSNQPKTRSQSRREAVALTKAEKQQVELERRQTEKQRMAERLKKRGESSRKERAIVARALL